MFQTLRLTRDPEKREIEPAPAADNGVAKVVENGAGSPRLQMTNGNYVSPVAGAPENGTELRRLPDEEINAKLLKRTVSYTDSLRLSADRFRYLRMRIRELSNATKLKTLLVTSALSLDGKSTVSLNLAASLADRGQHSVLLLEADLYHPTLVQRLGLKNGPGLKECLTSGLDPLSVVRRVSPLGCYFLSAGTQMPNPSGLLDGEEFAHIMRTLSPHFQWIVVDSPPVVPVADAIVLARHADASLLVVRAGRTPVDAVDKTIELLGANHIIGVILNGVEGLEQMYSKYNKYYGPSAATNHQSGNAES